MTDEQIVPINEMHHSINKVLFILGILLFIASYIIPNHTMLLAGIFCIIISAVLSAYLIHDMKRKLKDTHASLVTSKADHEVTKGKLATSQAELATAKKDAATAAAATATPTLVPTVTAPTGPVTEAELPGEQSATTEEKNK